MYYHASTTAFNSGWTLSQQGLKWQLEVEKTRFVFTTENTVILTPKIRSQKKIMNEAHSDRFKHKDVVNTRKIKISFHASNITDYSNKQSPPPKYTGVRFHDIHTQNPWQRG